MIISDLSYLEVVSEVPSIVGGERRRTNESKIKQRSKVTVKNSIVTGNITASNDASIVTSNDNL